jgi:hypothetical protein
MKRSSVLIVIASGIAGVLAVMFTGSPFDHGTTGKSDRLDGPPAETAFLPERFGVARSQQ